MERFAERPSGAGLSDQPQDARRIGGAQRVPVHR